MDWSAEDGQGLSGFAGGGQCLSVHDRGLVGEGVQGRIDANESELPLDHGQFGPHTSAMMRLR